MVTNIFDMLIKSRAAVLKGQCIVEYRCEFSYVFFLFFKYFARPESGSGRPNICPKTPYLGLGRLVSGPGRPELGPGSPDQGPRPEA